MSVEDTEPPVSTPIAPTPAVPPIASFWRRFAASAVDGLLWGVVGQALGWALSPFWFQVGPYGRIVGLLVTLPYYGIMNSRIGNGQTIGKRVLGIAVRDGQNSPISPVRSLVRISILEAPAIFNQWSLPIFQSGIIQWLLSIVIFGAGGVILYTMIFNRKTRQGLHDLVCGTYVVKLTGTPIVTFPNTSRLHIIISTVILTLAVILSSSGGFIARIFVPESALASMYDLVNTLQDDNRFFTTNVSDITRRSGQGQSTRTLQVQVWYRGLLADSERSNVLNDIARVVLKGTENLNQYDSLLISVRSAYDLGIAFGSLGFTDVQSIDVWKQRVGVSSVQ